MFAVALALRDDAMYDDAQYLLATIEALKQERLAWSLINETKIS